MKKNITIVGMIAILLSGCSFMEDLNQSVEYVNDATTYINEANQFREELPKLAEEAIANNESVQELKNSLINMKEDAEIFIAIEPPQMAEDIHAQLTDYSEQLKVAIDTYLENIELGNLDLTTLEDSQILTTLNEISSVVEQLEQLGS
ncbi:MULTISPECIES: DUF6376 family protein [Bacillus]|uniref:DUF6376 family protein n=1 Tax=Bacillus TaxID=1386 RepID=UPI000C76F73C|nr:MULTISPECIES: DUF6376 family protein [Bacillus]PLR83405.1 hypothetical protein CVD23_14510 [Bacillus sp. V33-4]RSK51765.1 hypothetical protein EJA13_13435 [Bacillus canaveralius]